MMHRFQVDGRAPGRADFVLLAGQPAILRLVGAKLVWKRINPAGAR
jgi:hypothetical protein